MYMVLIVRMKFGSHLYGTDTEDSDVDYKGIFLPTKEAILLNRVPKTINLSTNVGHQKNRPGDIDEEIYSLHYFIQLACEGQIVAMDMLHAPEIMLIETSAIWREIVKHRNLFYTKNLTSFISYARRQASKYGIKGSRLDAAKKVISVLRSNDPDRKLREIWTHLPINDHCRHTEVDPNGMPQYQVCGKTFQESTKVEYVLPIVEKFYDDYGQRAKLAAQNKSIDWKAISHALRAAFQTREILIDGTIAYPLKDAPFLLEVKSGRLDYTAEVAPVLESLMEEVEQLASRSSLPEKVDIDYWNRFICEIMDTIRDADAYTHKR